MEYVSVQTYNPYNGCPITAVMARARLNAYLHPAGAELPLSEYKPGDKVVLLDDLIATGGTMKAAAELVEELGGEVVEMLFLIELVDLKGREVLSKYKVDSVVQFEGA